MRVPAGRKVVLDVTGKGVQVYDCKPSAADPNVLTWTFREPAAVLYGHRGRPVGIHFVGPTFESFDGSAVVGARSKSVQPDPTAIPGCCWRPTPTGATACSPRSTSSSGSRPGAAWRRAGACDPATDATVAVPYQARYVLYAD